MLLGFPWPMVVTAWGSIEATATMLLHRTALTNT